MNVKSVIKELFILTIASIIIGSAVFFFMMPSHAAVSSISGFAIVLTNFIPYSVSQITMVLNVVLLIIGFITCGPEFGYKTVYTSILLPVVIGVFEKMLPDYTSLTGDATLDVVCYIFVVSIGSAILFNRNASSGGLDIVGKILNKYFRIDIGKAMSIAGLCIALSSALAYDSKTVVLSILGTYLNGMVLDHFIFDQKLKRRVCIVSPYEAQIRDYILNELHSGASVYKVTGAYRMEEHDEIITIVDKGEFQKLMAYIDKVDPKAFVTVYKVSYMQYQSKSMPERVF
ncbi:MAG: YitT family protein [Pseudobutyrivibrio ruminis]|uniref:YitT family protein n=1 Tax=Pseudobutyrivibrio ruminis TaxID=46206 RepID=UPI0026EC8CE8|nr:YitT family protein [Pseudobutyrivibrio ruminis]MBE5914862.1 YitT family protein [Pseudobutyrivibrio ruminis]